ncbi:DUF4055 domain-containing protein [candidate division KSB1 bacterium]|nr:DUF4055 domain-containing protein [candidate division KSB1 bacterium]
MTDKPDLSARSKDSAAMLPFWKKVAAIIGGENDVKEAGEEYLPKLPHEPKKQYDFRLSVAKFTNLYRDTVESLVAKPFEEEISLVAGENETVPEQIASFAENVDGDGNNLTVFSSVLFFNAINDAITWIFIDYPNVAVRTMAEAKKAGVRPYWTNVLAINVLEARQTRIGGESVLSYIRILEPGESMADDKVRIFERNENIVTWSLNARGEKSGEWIEEDSGTLSLSEIPLIPIMTGRRDGRRFFFRAALQDAVDLQMTLYRQESALEYTKVMTAFPMLSASGVKPRTDSAGNPEPITVGPQTTLYAPMSGDGKVGSWSYVEPSGESLKFLQDDVKETKQDLRELGKRPLSGQAGLTVITAAYAANKAKSAVAAWGLALKDSLENALVITCTLYGIKPETYSPEVSVYDDYDNFTNDDFTSVMELRKNKDISRETAWTEAKRRGILSPEFTEEKEAGLLLAEMPGDGETEFKTPESKEPKT